MNAIVSADPRPDKAQFQDRQSAEPCATPLPVLSATLNFPCLTSSRSWQQNCYLCTPGHESGDLCLVTSPTNSVLLPQSRSKPAQRRWSVPVLRLLIADDHEIVRRGLCALLKSHAEWEVCAEAGDGREAPHFSSRSSTDQSRTKGEMGKHQEAELRQHHCLTRRATISLISSSDNIDPIPHRSEILVIVGQPEPG